MSCRKCGAACQGRLCKMCERAKSREGDWEDQLGDGYAPVDTTEDDDE